MFIGIALIVIAILVFLGMKAICAVGEGRSYIGHRIIRNISRWQREKLDIWAVFPLKQLVAGTARIVCLDEASAEKLGRSLIKAGVMITPRVYTAKKYLIVAFGICLMAIFLLQHFFFGIVVCVMVVAYALIKLHNTLTSKIKKKELIILQEMPRFARTICRSLQNDRDLVNVIGAYRKTAGPELGSELDVLLAEMKSGNVQNALIHFEDRLGIPEVSRLCGAIRDMSMGIDQTATLSYMADDMARQAKENIRKELSLRPGKMRRTYYPAIGICIAMIMYVLVVYVINNFTNLF